MFFVFLPRFIGVEWLCDQQARTYGVSLCTRVLKGKYEDVAKVRKQAGLLAVSHDKVSPGWHLLSLGFLSRALRALGPLVASWSGHLLKNIAPGSGWFLSKQV